MKQNLYTTGQLAEKALVTIRTLRYYDKVGLLKPSHHSDGGHRLYTDEDLFRLEQILGLKFLGFSLTEIKRFLEKPKSLSESLAMQKEILKDKKERIEQAMDAIEEVEKKLSEKHPDWNSILNLLRVIRLEKDDGLVGEVLRHFRPNRPGTQGTGMDEENLHRRAAEAASGTSSRLQRGAGSGGLPEVERGDTSPETAGGGGKRSRRPEAQELAKRWWELVQAFTKGDEESGKASRKG